MLVQVPCRYFIIKQNLKRVSPALIWTTKLRSIWIYRNIFILLTIRHQLKLTNTLYWNWTKDTLMHEFLTNYLLIRKLHFLLINIHQKSYAIRVSNISKSCDYWSLTNGINYSYQNSTKLNIQPLVNPFWTRIYVKPKSLVGLFVAKKLYKLELIKFILLLIHSWRPFNRNQVYNAGYPILTNEWLWITFLGTFYFKIFNF